MLLQDQYIIRLFHIAPIKDREGMELEKMYNAKGIYRTLEEARNDLDVIASYENYPYCEIVQMQDHISQLVFVAHEQLMGKIPKNLMYLMEYPVNYDKKQTYKKLFGSNIYGPFRRFDDRNKKSEELEQYKKYPFTILGEELGEIYLGAANELLNPSKF
jgi:hypothetical protein